MNVIRRIVASKKAIYAMVPVVANAAGAVIGADVQHPAMLVLDLAFASLLLAQWILDLRWGSPSDGTGAS